MRVYFYGNILMPVSGIPGIPQAEGATVAKLYIFPVLKKQYTNGVLGMKCPPGGLFTAGFPYKIVRP